MSESYENPAGPLAKSNDAEAPLPEDAALEARLLATPAGGCPPVELLFAAREGVLPQEANEQVLGHVRGCAVCRMLLEDAASLEPEAALSPALDQRIRDRIAARLASSERGAASERFASRRGAPWAIAAALLLVGVGAGLLQRSRTHTLSLRAGTAAPAAVAPTAAVPPGVLAELRNVTPLPPPASASPELATRGAATSAAKGPTVAELLPAFRAYNAKNYAAAAAGFTALASRYPQAETPALYLGVSELELGRNAEAATALQHALDLAAAKSSPPVLWYLGVAQARRGDLHAGALFRQACAAGPNGENSSAAFVAESCSLAKQFP